MTMLPCILACMLLALCREARGGLTTIYTNDEVKYCGGFISKGPNFAVGDGYVYTVNGCGKERAKALNASATSSSRRRLDSVAGHVIVFKSSGDGGKTWGNFQKVSGVGSSNVNYGSAKIIYDNKGKRLILQFVKYPSGRSEEPAGAVLFQVTSSDRGNTWSNKRNLTSVFGACLSAAGNPPRGVAGNRIQTPTGRIIFGGFGYKGQRCIWYTDDGGETYTSTGLQQRDTNEWSMAIAGDTGKLVINSRKNGMFGNYRPNVFSSDDGVTWSSPVNSGLKDAVNQNNHGCEASILSIGSDLFYMNPSGPTGTKQARTKMRVRCSKDGGNSLASAEYAITETDEGGYSMMADVSSIRSKKPLLLGWGFGDYDEGGTSNIYVKAIGTSWCN